MKYDEPQLGRENAELYSRGWNKTHCGSLAVQRVSVTVVVTQCTLKRQRQ